MTVAAVLYGRLVHVYDWMLKQQAALNLDHEVVNDVAFMGTERVLIGTENCGPSTGGMACFDVASREVVHRYEVKHDEQLRNFEVSDIATDNGEHVFALCKYAVGTDKDDGFGIWDHTTGQQIKHFSGIQTGFSVSSNVYRNRLQWLPESRLMLVASGTQGTLNSWLSLFDVRANAFVWASYHPDDMSTPMEIEAMDNFCTLWVADGWHRLGFLDIRVHSDNSRGNGIQWGHPGAVLPPPLGSGGNTAYSQSISYQPCLASWGSHLFASVHDSVYVISNPNWQAGSCKMTRTVSSENEGDIADIAVGGDRLFILHLGSEGF